jgi:hypothetical protein
MKYIIAYLLFVLAGIWLSFTGFAFLGGHPPNHLTWGRVICVLIPTALSAFTFLGFYTGTLFTKADRISRKASPIRFYVWSSVYMLINIFLYYVSRYVP